MSTQTKLGKQGSWEAVIDDDGLLKVFRPDGKFFEIDLITKGFDRPILVNYGVGMLSAVLMGDGRVVTEPETIVTSLDGEQLIQQDRVLRASQDNPNYDLLPAGDVKTGEDFLDGQRIIYRDGLPQSLAMVADVVPLRKVKTEKTEETPDGFKFVPCGTATFKQIGASKDGPGKIALFNAMTFLLDDGELAQIADLMVEKMRKMQQV